MWLADLGAWPSAGGIWVICIILAIDGAARPRVTKEESERQRTLSTPGGLERIPESEGPPRPFYKPGNMPSPTPKKAAPFKVGDRVRDRGTKITGTIADVSCGKVVVVDFDRNQTGIVGEVWFKAERLELICEKQS